VVARWTQDPTHVFLGQWYQPAAVRKNIDGFVIAPVTVFWNVTKAGK
jgi:peptide/nickel transport system substrate-binding protein